MPLGRELVERVVLAIVARRAVQGLEHMRARLLVLRSGMREVSVRRRRCRNARACCRVWWRRSLPAPSSRPCTAAQRLRAKTSVPQSRFNPRRASCRLRGGSSSSPSSTALSLAARWLRRRGRGLHHLSTAMKKPPVSWSCGTRACIAQCAASAAPAGGTNIVGSSLPYSPLAARRPAPSTTPWTSRAWRRAGAFGRPR